MFESRRLSDGQGFTAGLTAGLAAAVAVALVSLPLRSPHDSLMNSGTIIAVAVPVTFALAGVWHSLGRPDRRSRRVVVFAAVSVGLIGASAAGAALVEVLADLQRTISYVVPLSAIQFGMTAVLAPALVTSRATSSKWLAAIVLVAVIAVGAGFAGQGDQESGRLSLPPRTQ